MLTIDQALSKQVELLKRTVDITDAFEFVEVPVEVLRVLIEDHELLANMTAERDALKAQLDAVPVGAIEVLRKEALDEVWERQALASDGPDGRHLAEIDVWLGLRMP